MNFKNVGLALGLAGLGLFVGSTSAQAALITSSQDPSLSNGDLIDFESVTPGSYTSITQKGVTFSTSANEVEYVSSDYSGQYNTQDQSLQNTYASNGFNSLTFSFSTPVTAFGFNWGASDVAWTLSAFDSSNTLLDSEVLPITKQSNAGDFLGIKNVSRPISRATLVASSPGDYVFIDNFRTSATSVPEPSGVLGSLAFGALGASTMLKRQMKKRNVAAKSSIEPI